MIPRYAPRWSFLGILLLVLAALFVVGCDGDSNDGGGGGGPTVPDPFVRVVPDTGEAPSVTMERSAATERANLVLDLRAVELENVRTIDFVLVYPGNLLRAIAVEDGGFLGAGTTVITTALDQNRLQVLMTRTQASGISGSGVVATVRFEAQGPGTGRLEWSDPEAATPFGLPIQGIEWLGADVEVSP